MTTLSSTNNNPDRYAVFGNPIAHSKSPILHAAFAKQTQQIMEYTTQCVEVDEFAKAADEFFNGGGKGLNVTVPFKIDAFNYAQALTERAKKAGAVNTLYKKNNVMTGDNTDGVGFVSDVTENLGWELANKNILILGAGGAIRGILGPVLEQQPTSVVIANRTVEKAEQLVEIFSGDGNIRATSYDQITGSFDIVINGTSAGLHGSFPELPDHLLANHSACYDLMYAKSDTLFIQWAKNSGSEHIADGLGMLVCQGAESFFQWRDIYPETKHVIATLRDNL